MKFSVIFLIFLSFGISTYSQTIRGNVVDKETKQPVYYATVYINGTSVGTYSDRNGYFKLNIANFSTMPLTISALGYYSATIDNLSSNRQIIVELDRKLIELSEVQINAREKERIRRENLRLFRKAFLGSGINARNCSILNEEDIRFGLSTDSDTLKAFSLNPILIDNSYLAYRLTYSLDQFILNKKDNYLAYIGSVMFKDYTDSKREKIQKYEKRRLKTYLGSKMHLFRSLWDNKAEAAGFVFTDTSGSELTYKNLVYEPDTGEVKLKYLGLPGELNLTYLPGRDKSSLTFLNGEVGFDRHGYFYPFALFWGGEMSKERVSDWLPYEYSLQIIDVDQIIRGTVRDINTEKPIEGAYIYTDRTFSCTRSDINGNFESDNTTFSSMPLTISSSGYYSVTLPDLSLVDSIKVYLVPKGQTSGKQQVTTETDKRIRKENMEIFSGSLLGVTINARDCEILNGDDIIFKGSSDSDTLEAISSVPLLISNKSLGYNIIYFLDDFQYIKTANSFSLNGKGIFREEFSDRNISYYEKRRKTSYLGSKMQFVRSLWEDSLASTGFVVQDSSGADVDISHLIIQTDNLGTGTHLKYLRNTNNLSVVYLPDSKKSGLIISKEYVGFDKSGFIEKSNIIWQGYFSSEGLADWLPYDYSF